MVLQKRLDEKLRITLLCPPTLAVLDPWQDTPSFGRPALTNLAGYLRQFDEFEIILIDAKFERMGFEDVLERVKKFNPHIIGFTAYTNEIKPAAYQSNLIKQHLPNVLSLIGGIHVTTLPEQTLKEFPTFDIGVIGEGELTLHELCLSLLEGKEPKNVRGVIYRTEDTLVKTLSRDRNVDLDLLPLPAWDMLPKAETYYIQTERGCPFSCTFCVNPNGKVARKRSVESVIEEMLLLINNYSPKHINFGDELFSVDISRTHLLLDEMIRHGIGHKVKWDCQTHVRFVNYELFAKMKMANVYEVYMGVETGDDLRLKKMGKGTTKQIIINTFKQARKANIRSAAFFIFGHPNESFTSVLKTISLAAKVNPVVPLFGLMVPYPGTEIARLSAKMDAGYLAPSKDWDDYRNRANGAINLKNISRRQMDIFLIMGYAYVFFANGRILDALAFVFKEWQNIGILLNRMLKGVEKTGEILKKPDDYDALFTNTIKATNSDIIISKEKFDETQKDEIKNIRSLKPELIMEQKMI